MANALPYIILPPNSVIGNISNGDAPASAIPLSQFLEVIPANLSASSGASLVGTSQTIPVVIPYLQTLSDIINGDPVSLWRFINPTNHSAIRARNSVADLNTSLVDAFASGANKLFVPRGQYNIDAAAHSYTLQGITLEGESSHDGKQTGGTVNTGSVFAIKGTTNSPFKVQRGTNFKGLGFWYPDQVDSATPIAYAPTIDLDFTDGAVQFVHIHDCVAFNAYRFLRSADSGGAVGHIWLTNNTLYGISTVFELTHNAEIIKLLGNSFTFGHWLAASEGGCRGYTRTHGSVMVVNRTDGFIYADNMAYGYLNGIIFATLGALCQQLHIADNVFDQLRFPVIANGTGNLTGTQITGNLFNAFNSQDTTLQGNAININTSGALAAEVLTITGNGFSTTTQDHIFVTGNTPTRQLEFSANSFTAWAAYAASGHYAALNINGSSTSYVASGNTILSQVATYADGIRGSCATANINGNTFGGCRAAIDATFGSVVLAGNLSFSTSGATSDIISATNIYQANNLWDKASGNTTRCAFLARKDAAQSTSGTTPLTVSFVTESYDKGSNWATPTFTAPKTGRYRFEYSLMHDASGTAADRFTIALTPSSGNPCTISYKMIADYNSVVGTGDFQMTSGDTLTLIITRVGGIGVFNTYNDATSNYLSGSLIE